MTLQRRRIPNLIFAVVYEGTQHPGETAHVGGDQDIQVSSRMRHRSLILVAGPGTWARGGDQEQDVLAKRFQPIDHRVDDFGDQVRKIENAH